MRKPMVLVFFLVLLAGCASLSHLERPRVSLASLQLGQTNLLSQDFRLGLRVDNPNDFGVRIDGAEVAVKLNGQTLATGLSNQSVEVPRYGSALVNVNAHASLLGIVRQVLSLSQRQRIPYEVTGKLRLTRGFGVEIPFKEAGELDWATLTGAQPGAPAGSPAL